MNVLRQLNNKDLNLLSFQCIFKKIKTQKPIPSAYLVHLYNPNQGMLSLFIKTYIVRSFCVVYVPRILIVFPT